MPKDLMVNLYFCGCICCEHYIIHKAAIAGLEVEIYCLNYKFARGAERKEGKGASCEQSRFLLHYLMLLASSRTLMQSQLFCSKIQIAKNHSKFEKLN